MMYDKQPVKLSGKTFNPVWSGSRLSQMYSRFRNSPPIGESWETSTDIGNESIVRIDNTDVPFTDYLNEIGMPYPPLVKLLDAASPLSIQVHPDEEAARQLGGTSKSELWYVLSAESESYILYGILPGIKNIDIENAILDGNIENIMNRVSVKVGDVFMIPPGMIHSLGGRITVLEVQNKAGTTYRVKDICSNRETHKKEAIASYRNYSIDDAKALLMSHYSNQKLCIPGKIIAQNTHFAVTRYSTSCETEEVTTKTSGVYMFCENGSGNIGELSFTAGDSLYLPSPERIIIDKKSSVLFVV